MQNMMKIELGKGVYTAVDVEDYEWLSQWKWHLCKRVRGIQVYKYVIRWATTAESKNKCRGEYGGDGRVRRVTMHREILRAPLGVHVDHVNRNGLDNRRANLRLCNRSQNALNRTINSNNKSGFKGVAFQPHNPKKPWRAWISIDKKQVHLGYFATPHRAAMAYDAAAIEHHGEFALTNMELRLFD
ncbi:MAG: HNH endonuclease [Candidatus Hodarchaeales archaeon]|jgi:hypothetical protein